MPEFLTLLCCTSIVFRLSKYVAGPPELKYHSRFLWPDFHVLMCQFACMCIAAFPDAQYNLRGFRLCFLLFVCLFSASWSIRKLFSVSHLGERPTSSLQEREVKEMGLYSLARFLSPFSNTHVSLHLLRDLLRMPAYQVLLRVLTWLFWCMSYFACFAVGPTLPSCCRS